MCDKRLKKNRKAIPAISLSTDTSAITAIGNDFHFKYIFSRQIEALSNENDVGIAISTSGNSENIIFGLKQLKKKNVYSLCIFGNNGGKAKKFVKNSFCIKNENAVILRSKQTGRKYCKLAAKIASSECQNRPSSMACTSFRGFMPFHASVWSLERLQRARKYAKTTAHSSRSCFHIIC